MAVLFQVTFGLALCLLAAVGLSFFISSINEGERRATVFGGLQLLFMLALIVCFFSIRSWGYFDTDAGLAILVLGLAIVIGSVYLLGSRKGGNPRALKGTEGIVVGEVARVDERDIEFSKMKEMMVRMGPPSGPPKPVGDTPKPPLHEPPSMALPRLSDREMNAAGMGPLGSTPGPWGVIDGPHGAIDAAMANASGRFASHFAEPDKFEPAVAAEAIALSPEEASLRIKGFAKNLGADLVGIAKLDPRWIYSHHGVSRLHLGQWGEPVKLKHRFAIVFAEEMDFDLIGTGPHTPVVVEAMNKYSQGAYISAQVANFVANLGYPAMAHNMAHYEVMLPPLAVDAGLGEMSRMGYVITKELGARLKLSAVTTDLELVPDQPIDIGVEDFCRICKKCANCCPSRSISEGDPEEVNGSLRWVINQSACFQYWNKVGTDCAVCMRVCPWSHARTFPHKLIVEAVSRNKYARRLFSGMDDLVYGRKPTAKAGPVWARYD